MALSANLFLRQSQSLVMTPQLMQSIQLLQMTHVELNQFIAQEVEKNPLLEFPANDGETGNLDADGPSSGALEDDRQVSNGEDWFDEGHRDGKAPLSEELDINYSNAFSDEAEPVRADAPELISQWKSMPGAGESGESYDLDEFVAGQVTLRDHLLQQLAFMVMEAADRLIALYLIDQVNDAGYLEASIGETAEKVGATPQDVERVLSLLQTMDPPGVCARTLSECLALQLRQKDRLDPAMQVFVANLELLARRDFATLKRLCGVDEEDLLDMLAEVRQLNPKPGNIFEAGTSEAIIADVVVRPSPEGGWLIELNADALPRVLVNQSYFSAVRKNSEDHSFLSECLQSANWLTRSLDQRARTILKVATEIVRQQDAFLLHGVDHLRPLNLKTVAEAIKMHESTVSRVTSNKYMLTPRGLFELKYFFTVSLGAVEGGDSHSAEAVRHRIRTLIANESVEQVLSDDDIVDILNKSGVELARRTVAKYRESMNIPSSVQRRREKKAIARIAAY